MIWRHLVCQSEISPWLCIFASCEEFVEYLWKKTRCLWSVLVVRPGWQWWFWIGRAGLRWLFRSAQLDAFLWRQKLRLLEVTSRRNNFTLEAITVDLPQISTMLSSSFVLFSKVETRLQRYASYFLTIMISAFFPRESVHALTQVFPNQLIISVNLPWQQVFV